MKAMATRCDLGLYAIDYRRNYGSFVVSTILQSLEVHPGKQPSRITRRVTPPAQRQHYVLRAVQFHSDADSHFVSTLNNQVSIKPRGFTDAVNAIRGGAAIQGCFSYETPDYMTFEGLERRASSLRGLSPAPRPPGSAALHDASRRLLTRSPPLPRATLFPSFARSLLFADVETSMSHVERAGERIEWTGDRATGRGRRSREREARF